MTMPHTDHGGRSPPERKVYVFRIWWTPDGEQWRCQLQDVNSGETIAFANDESLLGYMRRLTTRDAPKNSNPGLR